MKKPKKLRAEKAPKISLPISGEAAQTLNKLSIEWGLSRSDVANRLILAGAENFRTLLGAGAPPPK